jgi:hypothetical protein
MKPSEVSKPDDLTRRILLEAFKNRTEIEGMIEYFTRRLKEIDDSIMGLCLHRDIVEGKILILETGSCMPPFRVCRTCGYAEQGWGCGYKNLAGAATASMPRGEALELVRKFVGQADLWPRAE